MPRHCIVPGCNSNYTYRNQPVTSVPTFSFPKDSVVKLKWIQAVRRQDWQPTNFSSVCAKHFRESDFSNRANLGPNKTPRLNKSAVPSIFPNFPKHLIPVETVSRPDPTVRQEKYISRVEAQMEQFLASDAIKNFQEFKAQFRDKLNLTKYFTFESNDKCVFFLVENSSDLECNISVRISVSEMLTVKVIVENTEVSSKNLEWVFLNSLKLTVWSQIENLLARYRHYEMNITENREYLIKRAVNYLKLASKSDEDFDHCGKIDILVNQIDLLTKVKPTYNSDTIVMSFLIYAHSSATYQILKKFLILPSKRHLQNISSHLNISPNYKAPSNDENYFNHVSKPLSDREKIIALLIDEIYVEKGLQYKGNNIVGTAANAPTECARTVMAFMIKSVFGNFKEMFRLVPVLRPTGDILYSLTKDVIGAVQKLGFKIILIITDNNKTNQNLFNKLNPNNNYFQNPDFPELNIYFQYDTVHLFKNIRNNWLNLDNLNHTFIFPDFETYQIKYASFSHFEKLYEKDKNLLIKKSYKLNHKTLNPNNLERQNVTLVDNIFHQSTIASLRENEGMSETAEFCEIIRQWWDIINSKEKFKGILKRNDSALPIKSICSDNFKFLEKFLIWLEIWKNNRYETGRLTKDTFDALITTTKTFINLIKFTFSPLCKADYILLGKCQSDDLEGRFRLYRSLAGCSYRVSYTEVVECEKKIRVHNIFAHNKKDYFKLLQPSNENSLYESTDLTFFDKILDNNFYLENVQIDSAANFYVTGYASHAIVKHITCSTCKTLVLDEKGVDSTFNYFNYLQRGGLSVAPNQLNYILFHMSSIFQEIIRNSDLKKYFFENKNQKGILICLTIDSLRKDTTDIDFEHECHCGKSNFDIYFQISKCFANILINNYVKSINDLQHSSKNITNRKLLTLK